MESQTKTQQNPGNAQVIPNQNPPGPGTIHSKSTSHLFLCYLFLKKECRQDIRGIVKFSTLRVFTSHRWNACFFFHLLPNMFVFASSRFFCRFIVLKGKFVIAKVYWLMAAII